MAAKVTKPKKSEEIQAASLVSSDPNIKKPRLKRLVISNFRAITSSVSIDLDDIVVLVGPNNSGKSSILRAYEVAMSQGSNAAKLTLEDFPNERIDSKNLPQIELITAVYDNSPGEQWIDSTTGESLVRERWTWNGVGDPIREGFNIESKTWDSKVPWGAPNVANSRRPIPHRIDAFSNPTDQASEITRILMAMLTERIKACSKESEEENEKKNEYITLLEKIASFQRQFVEEAKEEISKVQNGVSEIVSAIFPGYAVEFDARPESDVEKAIQFFKAGATLKMGPSEGYKSTIDRQGSGARRTLLWSALKFLEETGVKAKKGETSERPHLLLMDEPEICLHPSAIRDACKVLYELPSTGNWQVMITTHSPAFIDLSRDNTTIIRVARNETGIVTGTTLHRPLNCKLDDDEKKLLKLLNIFDTYVGEFFFGSKNIIVEGDTEFTAFRYVIGKTPELFNGVHVIRARGKATIALLTKILNQFSSDYAILHDSDFPKTKEGKSNPAWTTNTKILEAAKSAPSKTKVRLVASKGNFEMAFLGSNGVSEKPYNVLIRLQEDDQIYKNIRDLLQGLANFEQRLPDCVLEWSDIGALETAVSTIQN